MAEAPAEQREEVGPRPALDLTALASSTPGVAFLSQSLLKLVTGGWQQVH